MEVFVHIIKDLNRCLNLGLYILVDSDRICLVSLSIGVILKELPCSSTLEFYDYLTHLKKQITSWINYYSLGKENIAHTLRDQIYVEYKFDIENHYKPSRYGKYI